MRKLGMTLALLFCVYAWAQENGISEFRANFAYSLRVAEAPCPEQLLSEFPKGACYRHGYKDFFAFKEAVNPYLLDSNSYPEPWRVATLRVGGMPKEVIRTTYRPKGSRRIITLIYLDKELLLLTVGVLSSSL